MRIYLVALLLSAGLLVAPAAQAQKQYQPGYLVLQRGDTLRGLLETPTIGTVARGVKLKKNSAAEPVFYPVKIVKALHLASGRTYLERTMQPVAFGDTLHLLLEPLVRGRATLYRSLYNVFANNADVLALSTFYTMYYYIERHTEHVEFDRPPYLLQSSTFRSDLRSLFSDCPHAPAVTGKFVEANLISLTQQYNACTGRLVR
ncbi:hypothetical protein A0257_20245 [Hymenobacter psoromatis]|nr:hypothetical protein A0257_20245 [Hymenobacter psoromatis]